MNETEWALLESQLRTIVEDMLQPHAEIIKQFATQNTTIDVGLTDQLQSLPFFMDKSQATVDELVANLRSSVSVGTYAEAPEFTDKNQFLTFEGIRYFPVSVPYQTNPTTYTDPSDDPNLLTGDFVTLTAMYELVFGIYQLEFLGGFSTGMTIETNQVVLSAGVAYILAEGTESPYVTVGSSASLDAGLQTWDAIATESVKARVTALETALTALTERVTTNETAIQNHSESISNLTYAVNNATTATSEAVAQLAQLDSERVYRGAWSSATGAAKAGQIFSHSGVDWLLKTDVADITTSTPSYTNSAWKDLVGELKAVAIANHTVVSNVAFIYIGATLNSEEYIITDNGTYYIPHGVNGTVSELNLGSNGVLSISASSGESYTAKDTVLYHELTFDTVSEMASYSGKLISGMQVKTRGHTVSGIGHAVYDVVPSSSVVADNRRVINSSGNTAFSFVLRIGSTTWLEQWGLVEGGDFYLIHKAATDYIRSVSDNNQSKRVVIRCMSGDFSASGTIDFYPFQAPFIADKEARIVNSHSNNYCSAVAFSNYGGVKGSVPGRDRQPQAFIKNLTIVVKNNQRGMLIDSDRYNVSGEYTYPSYLGLELENVQFITDSQPNDGDLYRGLELGQSVYELICNHCESWYMTEHVLCKDVSGSAIAPNTGVGIQFNDCHFTYANESVAKQRGFTLLSNRWKVNLNGCSLLHLHEPIWLQDGASISLLNSRIEGSRLPEGENSGEAAPISNGFVQITSGGKFSMVGGDMINYLKGSDINFKAPFYVSGGTEEAQAQINMISVDAYGMRGSEFSEIGGVWVAFDGIGGTADINIRDNFRRHTVSTDDDPLLISINSRGDEKEVPVNPISIICRNTTDGDGTGLISSITAPTSFGIPSSYEAFRLQKDGSNSSVLSIPIKLKDQSKQVSCGFYANSSESVPYEIYFCNMVRDFSSYRSIVRLDKYTSEISGFITSNVDFSPYYMCTKRPVGGYEFAIIEFDFSGLSSNAYVDIYALVVNNFR